MAKQAKTVVVYKKGDRVRLNKTGKRIFGEIKFFRKSIKGTVVRDPRYAALVDVLWDGPNKERGALVDYIKKLSF